MVRLACGCASGFGFCVFRFGGFGPAAKIEGYGHAGVAQFVGKGGVDQGAGDDHASDAEGGDALCCRAARAAIVQQAALEDAHHGSEDGLEGAPGGFAAASDVGGQGHHGAGILNVFKMLAGEIGADDLRANVGGGKVHFDAFPATLPIRVSEEAGEHLGIEVALAVEIAIEAAMSEARTSHDLVDGNIFKAVTIEEFTSTIDDGFLDCRAMTSGIRHGAPCE